MSLERIIITFEKDGSLRGISSTDFEGLPKALAAADLAAISGIVDSATIASLTTAEAAKADAETKLAAVLAAADSDDLATVKEKAAEAKLNESERKIAELEKRKAEIEKEIDEAKNPKIAESSESIEAPRR